MISANLGWSKGGLLGWYKKELTKNLCPTCRQNLNDPDKIKSEAADAGTLCHEMIENHIKDKPSPDVSKYSADAISKAEAGFLNYLEWVRQTNFQPITMEVPLVCEELQTGTTIDVLGMVAGKLCIVECKTSNSVYEDFLIQVAMQQKAWNEKHPDKPVEGLHLLKVGKEEANFTHHYWGALPDGLEAFKHLRALHELKKKLRKLT